MGPVSPSLIYLGSDIVLLGQTFFFSSVIDIY